MKLIPGKKITVVTEFTKHEVLERFRQRVGSKQYKNWNRVDKNIFTGSRVDEDFELELITNYRNSFTPVIKGKLTESHTCTELKIVFRSNWPVTIATLIFMAFGLALSIGELVAYLKNETWIFWYFPAFVLFPYGLWWIAFNIDTDQAIDGILKITQGKLK